MKPRFTHKWNRRNLHWLDMLTQRMPKGFTYLEIGVFECLTMRWILEKTDCSWAIGVDLWKDPIAGTRVAAATVKANAEHNVAEFPQRAVLVEQDSVSFLLSTNWEPFDFVFIDGSHDPVDVLVDVCLTWPRVSPGGILLLDDWRAHEGIRQVVGPVVERFANVASMRKTARGRQFYMQKR